MKLKRVKWLDKYEFLINKSKESIQIIFDEKTSEGTKNPEITEIMPLLLFKKIVDNIEAINSLNILKTPGDVSYSIARNILENYWNMLYMIKEDQHFRQLAYSYSSTEDSINGQLKNLELAEKVYKENLAKVEGYLNFTATIFNVTLAQRQFNKNKMLLDHLLQSRGDIIEQLLEKIDVDSLEENNKEYEKQLNIYSKKNKEQENFKLKLKEIKNKRVKLKSELTILNSNEIFANVIQEIKNTKKETAQSYYKWYQLKSGINSLAELAKHLGKNDEYYKVYNSLSLETHSMNAINQVLYVKEESTQKLKLNYRNQNEEPLSVAMTYLSYSIGEILSYYDKVEQFENIRKDMQKYFTNE